MNKKYIDAKTFEDFKINQEKLINVLNHNMTDLTKQSKKTADSNIKLSNDVNWLKKFTATQTGLLIMIFMAMIGIIAKMIIG
jgi:hypothetical protein